MTINKPSMWLAACCLVAALTASASAQFDYLGPDSDLQFFSPVDFDFDDQPEARNGWFFAYDKLSWNFGGERLTIGSRMAAFATTNPDLIVHSGGLGVPDLGGPTEGARIVLDIPATFSGINNGPPRSDFAWGERYEFGYRSNGNEGWLVGILDGPEAHSNESYGFGPLGPGGVSSALGSVLVVFEDGTANRDAFRGFIDFENSLGNIVVGGDGIHDDIDDDGKHGGHSIVDLMAPGNIPETDIDITPDFDDLVQLPTTFETMSVSNTTEMQGVELMYTYRADNSHKMIKHQNREFEVAYGLRFLRLRDEFRVSGTGGTLGTSRWDTRVDNNLVGPQIMMKWKAQRHRLGFDFGGRFLFGYNVENLDQDVALLSGQVPGQANSFYFLAPTVASHGKQEQDFSPLVELRAQTSYQITSSIAFRAGYTATFIDNIRRAANQVRYNIATNMGFRDDAGTQEIFVNGANIGFDVVY